MPGWKRRRFLWSWTNCGIAYEAFERFDGEKAGLLKCSEGLFFRRQGFRTLQKVDFFSDKASESFQYFSRPFANGTFACAIQQFPFPEIQVRIALLEELYAIRNTASAGSGERDDGFPLQIVRFDE